MLMLAKGYLNGQNFPPNQKLATTALVQAAKNMRDAVAFIF